MKKSVIGIVAHVDCGKTTLIESMLFNAGIIKKLGRVDNQDAFLDYDSQERQRGITIYSKQANFKYHDMQFMILDTPGHSDFSSEMERTLNVCDSIIILVNGQNGVQPHSETIFKLLEHYQLPVTIFVNKMDISYLSKEQLIKDIQSNFASNCFDVEEQDYLEKIAMQDDELTNEYLTTGTIEKENIAIAYESRKFFPIVFGAALKNQNVDTLMNLTSELTIAKEYPEEFGGIVYKITSDENNNRLTHIKITGGTLKAKQKVTDEEKVDQIRIYNGTKFTMVDTVEAGEICTIKGFKEIPVGTGLGFEYDSEKPQLAPYLDYQVLLPKGVDPIVMMSYLTKIETEDPSLQVEFNTEKKTIFIHLMGEIQIEILKKRIFDLSNINVEFGPGKILYKETIQNVVYGHGHYEPLRHFADVFLKLEPLPANSGIQFDSSCLTDDLSLNWQRLILTHLKERTHRGVLTGAPITDIKITLVSGQAHLKHTEGGDFRQATYRAVRHGLKLAQSVLLEPFYQYQIEVSNDYLSKVLFDLENMKATVKIDNLENKMVITGKAPVRTMQTYNKTLLASTKGTGKFSCELEGYYPCEDAPLIIEQIGYDSESDLRNPTGSVYCEHGSGVYVPFDQVPTYQEKKEEVYATTTTRSNRYIVDDEEVKRVVAMLNGRNKKEKKIVHKDNFIIKQPKPVEIKEKCLIVDGYNMIFAWPQLNQLSKESIEIARDKLIDMLISYQGFKGIMLMVVFDGYKVKDNRGTLIEKSGTCIVYTKSGQTADSYIEMAIRQLKNKYQITVATSDNAEQSVVFAQGALRISARELLGEIENTNFLIKQRTNDDSYHYGKLFQQLQNIDFDAEN